MSTEPGDRIPGDPLEVVPALGPDRPASLTSAVTAAAGPTVSATSHVGRVREPEFETHMFAPPTKRVGSLFVFLLVLAQFVFFLALLGPAIIAIAVKVTQIVPDDQKTSALSIVTSFGAIAAFLGNVIFGRLSDRTTSRFGRRRPWIVCGCVVMTAAFALMAEASTVSMLTIGWFIAQIGANAAFAPFIATIADHVPMEQRAKVSSLVGIAQNVGVLVAVYLAQALTDHMMVLFVGPGIAAIAAMLVYAAYLPDQRLPAPPPRLDVRGWLRTFWVSPREHPDFGLAWLSRFLIVLASFMFSTYRLYFLVDRVGLTNDGAAATVATGVLIYTIALVAAGYVGGWISDRSGKRKLLVATSAVLFGVGMAVLVGAHTVPHFYVVELIMGLSYGVYMGVDLALVIDVLPNPDDSGKDLGVFNMANAIPQTLAPGVAGVLLAVGSTHHQNYNLMFAIAALVCLAGGVVVLFVKKVR
jgi:MFS family permease